MNRYKHTFIGMKKDNYNGDYVELLDNINSISNLNGYISRLNSRINRLEEVNNSNVIKIKSLEKSNENYANLFNEIGKTIGKLDWMEKDNIVLNIY